MDNNTSTHRSAIVEARALGAIFDVVDHLWHDELFLISSNWIADIALGCTITGTVFEAWGLTVGLIKIKPSLAYCTRIIREYRK